jgi:L-amino acid N-acyltransferase YncA
VGGCRPVSSRPVYSGVAEISLYVGEKARGQGIGTELLAAFVREADAAGIWTLQTSVFPETKRACDSWKEAVSASSAGASGLGSSAAAGATRCYSNDEARW